MSDNKYDELFKDAKSVSETRLILFTLCDSFDKSEWSNLSKAQDRTAVRLRDAQFEYMKKHNEYLLDEE